MNGNKKINSRIMKSSIFFIPLALIFCIILFGICFNHLFLSNLPTLLSVLLVLCCALILVIISVIILYTVGILLKKSIPQFSTFSPLLLAKELLRGELTISEDKNKKNCVTELSLQQFVQQVQAYNQEKIYLKRRGIEKTTIGQKNSPENDLLNRRWNDVADSLNELELYLANKPADIIAKFVNQSVQQQIDVSQVFREVTETFDSTWRAKGVHIESAIVIPLKAVTNESVLRRLLVGPWRSALYFAKSRGSVVFTAKSEEGKVVARWSIEGMTIPEPYLQTVLNTEKGVNERIDEGLKVLSPPGSLNPNIFHALVSFITWIDLAKYCNIDFSFKNSNDGFVIVIRL